MPNFRHILNVRTRAIEPEYNSQWFDLILVYTDAPDGVDYIQVGYPYSTGNRQITDSPYTLDGEINESSMFTIDGDPMLTISGSPMKRIPA